MPLTGHLSDLSLSELIEFFCNQRKTGQLKVLYPQGHGYFYLQSGSVVDARIGVLRGIDAVYYSLTLPSAKFEFSGTSDPIERTINQPWTQVVLEGLRRLDEGVVPTPAFPPDYDSAQEAAPEVGATQAPENLEDLRVPSFLSFSRKSLASRTYLVAGAVTLAILLSVAAIGVPAGWYGRKAPAPVVSQPAPPVVNVAQETPATTTTEVVTPEPVAPTDNPAEAALRRQKDRERAAAREERMRNQESNAGQASPGTVTPVPQQSMQAEKAGPKKVTVTVTYDESGRVTQASGGDASAIRIARQKRFPAGKAGSATVTIPIN